MSVAAKICGVNTPLAMSAAVDGGARLIGVNFYPPSPRAVTPETAAALVAGTPPDIAKVGVFVDPDDDTLAATLATVRLDMIQLHGGESPARVAAVRARFDVPVMKVIAVSGEADVEAAGGYAEVADWLLFDARAPKDMKDALPGGNALAFDWRLLAGRDWPKPWLLAGGLEAGNIAEAVRISGARAVDVSSGVEDRPGHKNPASIAEFLTAAAAL